MADRHAPGHKHIPVRTCVVCRTKDAKRVLTRIVRTSEGVVVDLSGKLNGRGAYICDRDECWSRALSGSVLSQALRTTLTDADRERLQRSRPRP